MEKRLKTKQERKHALVLKTWEQKKAEILQAAILISDSEKDQEKRIQKAKKDFAFFVKTYFPHYAEFPTAKFQVDAAKAIQKDKNIIAVLEWAREHAKSVHADVLFPIWLMIQNELKFMVLVGSSKDNAVILLQDLKLELEVNPTLIHDFGEFHNHGSWSDDHFVTKQGQTFVARGRGQSPRGLRNRKNRPDYLVLDDVDDDEIVNNSDRMDKLEKWFWGAMYGALRIAGARIVVAGNRIHKKSLVARIAGNINAGDKLNEGVFYQRINAWTEKKREDGTIERVLAWAEKFKIEDLERKISKMPRRISQIEYFNNPMIEGKIFKAEHFHFKKRLKKYNNMVGYFDPSFSDRSTADFKAIVVLGKEADEIHLLDSFCRKCSISEAMHWMYTKDIEYRKKGITFIWWIEKQFYNQVFEDELYRLKDQYGYLLRLVQDDRVKPNKKQRIESLEPLFTRSLVAVSDELKGHLETEEGINQFLLFSDSSNYHDDFPDAFEGAAFKLEADYRVSHAPAPRVVIRKKQRL